jgi:hypothetical protein
MTVVVGVVVVVVGGAETGVVVIGAGFGVVVVGVVVVGAGFGVVVVGAGFGVTFTGTGLRFFFEALPCDPVEAIFATFDRFATFVRLAVWCAALWCAG